MRSCHAVSRLSYELPPACRNVLAFIILLGIFMFVIDGSVVSIALPTITMASVACGLSTTLSMLIFFRAVQAAGAVMFFSISTVIIFQIYHPG